MAHASELIRQIIRKQGLHIIYPGQEESSFGDLIQTAWVQIEKTLYKFRARPHCRPCFNPGRPSDSLLYNPGEFEYGIITYHEMIKQGIAKCQECGTKIKNDPEVIAAQDLYGGSESVLFRGNSKVFNMWSQIARTVILAHIKKEGRDRKNSSTYRYHVAGKIKHIGPEESVVALHREVVVPAQQAQLSHQMMRFLSEAREMCGFNDDYLLVLDALENLLRVDDKPSEGIIGKLVEHSGLSRVIVTQFMKHIRLRSFEFTDSPINCARDNNKYDRRKTYAAESDDD